jgi:DNA polymerase III subunit delta
MLITTEQLEQHLAAGVKPLYTVFGAEALLALEAGDRIRAAARAQGDAERVVLVAEAGFAWGELALAAGSQSLFAARRLLEVRIPSGRPGVEGGAALQRHCAKLPPDTVTLVQLPDIDWRSRKSAWFEALAAAGVAVEARVVARSALPQWLAGRLRAQRQEADPETLRFIAERVEGNLVAAYQEVRKLALIYPPGPLSHEDVRSAVLDVARYDVFALGRVVLEGDALRLKRMIDGLEAEGASLPLTLWALTDAVRVLGRALTAVAAGRPLAPLMQDARIRDPAHRQALQESCRRHTLADVTEGLRHAARVDRMIKGLAPGDVWDEILQLGLRFARRAPAGRKARDGGVTNRGFR